MGMLLNIFPCWLGNWVFTRSSQNMFLIISFLNYCTINKFFGCQIEQVPVESVSKLRYFNKFVVKFVATFIRVLVEFEIDFTAVTPVDRYNYMKKIYTKYLDKKIVFSLGRQFKFAQRSILHI